MMYLACIVMLSIIFLATAWRAARQLYAKLSKQPLPYITIIGSKWLVLTDFCLAYSTGFNVAFYACGGASPAELNFVSLIFSAITCILLTIRKTGVILIIFVFVASVFMNTFGMLDGWSSYSDGTIIEAIHALLDGYLLNC